MSTTDFCSDHLSEERIEEDALSIRTLIEDDGEVIFMSLANHFNGRVNIVYGTGKGYNIDFKRFSGKRRKYVSVYEPGTDRDMWATDENKIFLITNNKKAAYTEVMPALNGSGRSAFKVAKVPAGEYVYGMQPASRVPNFEEVPTEIYQRGYFVKIKHPLW